MMRRRGQAALEYLVTYGWGILAILVVIGALGYFGFLSPSRYVPARCSFGAQLECVDYYLEGAIDGTNNGMVSLRLQNSLGDQITLSGAWIADDAVMITRGDGSGKVSIIIPAGNVSDPFNLTLPTTASTYLSADDRAQAIVTIQFRRTEPSGSPEHNVTGVVFGTAQAPPGSRIMPPIEPPTDPPKG